MHFAHIKFWGLSEIYATKQPQFDGCQNLTEQVGHAQSKGTKFGTNQILILANRNTIALQRLRSCQRF